MRAMTNGALSRFNPAQPGAQGMKVVATGLLVVMAAVFASRARFEQQYPVAGLREGVRGGGDGRRPRRLVRGDRACSATRSACRSRTRRSSRATRTASAKRSPTSSRRISSFRPSSPGGCRTSTSPARPAASCRRPAGEGTRIRAGASRLIADIFESLDDERLGGIVKGAISTRLRKTEVSPLLGHALASAINEDRHVPMLEAAIRWTARALDANEPLIRDMVHKKANWVLKLAGLDAKLADAIIDGLRKLTVEMSTDPAHPVRIKVEEALAQLANDLQTRPETRERVEAIKEQLLDNRSVSLWLDTLWQKGREAIIKRRAQPRRGVRRQARRSAEIDGRDARKRPPHPDRDQSVRAPRGRRHGGELRQLDRQAGLGNGARLGRADGDRPARSRGRPRPSIYPHQRHLGRRPRRADPPRLDTL